MNSTYKIGGILFAVALMASVVIPAFAENESLTGTSTKPRFENEIRIGKIASSTAARLERQAKAKAKAAAAQCLRDATKTANQTYKSAMKKAQDDYKAAMMAARQAMLNAKQAAKTQCGITTQTSTSTTPNL